MAEERDETELSDVVQMAHRYYRESKDHTSKWRQEAHEDFAMVAGDQWDESDLATLQDQDRPAVVFNRIARTVNAIIGTQVSNRQETRFIPRELGDVQVNEILTAAAEWARDNCDAEDEESDAFEDMCTCGMGWTETRMDYEADPEGEVIIERVDPLEMYWDPAAKKRNIADARWVMHITRMSLEEIQQRWPGVVIDSASDPWDGHDDENDPGPRHHVYSQDAYNGPNSAYGGRRRTMRVARLQWCEYEEVLRVGPSAERAPASKKLEEKLKESGIPYIKQNAKVWKQAFVAGGTVLEEGDSPYPEGPTMRCMTYKRDRNKNLWFGVVRSMKDPQRFGNKFFSQILDILNKGAKGGVLAEKDAFDDPQKAEERWARPDGIIWLKPGAMAQNKVMPKPTVNLPAGLDKLMQFSMDGVHDVTGINLELLGMANREQAGVLEHQRKQAGLTIIAPLFDGMRRYRKEQGRVLLHFIQTYMSDGRLIRIIGQDGNERYIPLVRQPDLGKFDVIVDEAPTSPNMKERVFGVLSELLPHLLKMGVPIPPSVLDYAPIPSKLSTEWKELMQQAQANPQQLQEQVQQLSQENAQLKDKKQEAMAQIELKRSELQAEMELKRAEAQAEMEMKRFEMEQELLLEREKAANEIALQQEKMMGDFQLNQRKIMADQDVAQNEALQKAFAESLKDGKAIEAVLGGNRSLKVERDESGNLVGVNIINGGGTKRMQIVRDENGEILGAETVQ